MATQWRWLLVPLTVALMAGCTSAVNQQPTHTDAAAPSPSATLLGSQPQGQQRTIEQCDQLHGKEPDLASALVAVNGEKLNTSAITIISEANKATDNTGVAAVALEGDDGQPLSSAAANPWQFLGAAANSASSPEGESHQGQSKDAANSPRYESSLTPIKIAKETAIVANRQVLPAPTVAPSSPAGIWKNGKFTAFETVQLLSEQLPDPVIPVGLTASGSEDAVAWLEQLAPAQGAASAHEIAWRVLVAKDGQAREIASSWQLTAHALVPTPTPYVAPVVAQNNVYFEATVPVNETTWEQQILAAPVTREESVKEAKPRRIGAGRLPAVLDGDVAWVEDTTMHGLDAENDRFTIRRLESENIVIDTGDYFKVQALAGGGGFAAIGLQDKCSARAWILRYDLQTNRVTGAFYTTSDQLAVSSAGPIRTWGNGAGAAGAQMYYWDLRADSVTQLGENPGYSVPFALGENTVAIPTFNTGDEGPPRVRWLLSEIPQ